MKKIKF